VTTPSSFSTLGVRVDAVQIPDVVATMERWIKERDRCHYVTVTGMHGVTEARHDSSFKAILNSADLVVPDGMPLVWIGRLRGRKLPRRVYGPELMMTFCKQTASRGYRYFFLRRCTRFARKAFRNSSRRMSWFAGCGHILSALPDRFSGRRCGNHSHHKPQCARHSLGRPEHAKAGALDV